MMSILIPSSPEPSWEIMDVEEQHSEAAAESSHAPQSEQSSLCEVKDKDPQGGKNRAQAQSG